MNWQPGGPQYPNQQYPQQPQQQNPQQSGGFAPYGQPPAAHPYAPPPPQAHPYGPPPVAPQQQAPQQHPYAPPQQQQPQHSQQQAHPYAPQALPVTPQGPPTLLVSPRPSQPAPPGPPTIIDVGKTTARRAVIGATVAGAIGLVAIISGFVGAVDGGAGAAIAAILIGAVFLLIGLSPIFMRKKVFRPVKLIIEQRGIRWDDPQGKPWALSWQELGGIAVTTSEPIQLPESTQDKIVGAATEKIVGKKMLVRIDLFPGDVGFRGRHPELEHLWELHRVKGGYRVPLGQVPKWVPILDAAFRHFQPSMYHGIVDEVGIFGLV